MDKTWKLPIQRRQRYYNVSVWRRPHAAKLGDDWMKKNICTVFPGHKAGEVQFGTQRNVLIPVIY